MKSNLHGIGLRYFVEVARTGSLKSASEALHVDVSALSRQISKMEQELQCALFERMPYGMVLSDAGHRLRRYAVRTMLEAEQIESELLGGELPSSGTVRLACSQGFAYGLMPPVITSFCQEYESVEVSLFVGSPQKVSQRIRDGESDIGITFNTTPESGITVVHTEPAPMYALLRHSDALANLPSISLADLDRRQVVLPESGTTLRQLVEICMGQSNVRLKPLLESNNHYTLYKVAEATGAVLFTALISVDTRFKSDGFVAIPLTDPILHGRSVQIQTMSDRTLPNAVSKLCIHIAKAIKSRSAFSAE